MSADVLLGDHQPPQAAENTPPTMNPEEVEGGLQDVVAGPDLDDNKTNTTLAADNDNQSLLGGLQTKPSDMSPPELPVEELMSAGPTVGVFEERSTENINPVA